MNAAPINRVLTSLANVRQRQPSQWSARCPTHDDKSPSLSVRETPEGAVLLHCFAGCAVNNVVAALSLNMTDLFPPRQLTGREPKRQPRLLTAVQALELLDQEAHLVVVAAANVLHGVALESTDLTRIAQAVGRISWLRQESTVAS